MSKTRHGRCGCGDVSFTTPDDPLIVHCCHCSYCQRESGSAFALNFLIEADRVEWQGETEEVVTPSHSGRGQRIVRCPTCRVALSSHYPGGGDAIHFLRVGTMDDTDGIEPDAHIYVSTKEKWLDIEGGAPAFAEFYDAKSFWSDDQRRRWVRATRG